MHPEVMDIEALVAYARIPRWLVYRLHAAGRLPGAKVGRLWRFHEALIDTQMIAIGRRDLARQGQTRRGLRARA